MRLTLSALALFVAACGVSSEEADGHVATSNVIEANDTTDLTGIWFGRVGHDSSYLELTRTEGGHGDVTGIVCEYLGHDCYPFVDGKLTNGRLTGRYSWFEFGATQTVDVDLAVSPEELVGTYHASKCGCTLQASLKFYASPADLPTWDD